MILFKNTERLETEFENSISPRLKIILFATAEMLRYSKLGTLIITHLIRTQKEQDNIYTSQSILPVIRDRYLTKKWMSVHQCGRGADIGVANLKNPQQITKWLNDNFQYSKRTFKPTAILEDLGCGTHIHIQVSPSETSIKTL